MIRNMKRVLFLSLFFNDDINKEITTLFRDIYIRLQDKCKKLTSDREIYSTDKMYK